jgi:uncharacterized membrane-anchored protein
VGLIGYAAKSLKALGVPVDADIAVGIGIPLVAIAAAFGMRRIRRSVSGALRAEPH